MILSQLELEDVEALYSGHLFLMADLVGPLLDQDEEEILSPSLSAEGKAPPSPSLSSSEVLFYSPPSSPLAHSSFLENVAKVDPESLSSLDADDLLNASIGADDSKDDSFLSMDWMVEKFGLNNLDLDSLIGSESQSSPEDFLTFNSDMDLGLDSLSAAIPAPHDELPLPSLPTLPLDVPISEVAEAKMTEMAPDEEVAMKSEPPSPPPPSPAPPSSSAETLELGSEVDVPDADKTIESVRIIPDSSGTIQTTGPIVLQAHFVVLLTNKEETSLLSLPDQSNRTPQSDSDCDSGIESLTGSPPRVPSPPPTASQTAGSSRTKPYSKPESLATSTKSSKVKSVSGAPKVEKKLKKMEQNKTAATRYRQKKRVEQELLNMECEQLQKRNHELAEKAESISREIQYLTDLMEEVRKRRSKTSSVQ
ncbi:cyclic AMP-dependent transcription factor ATF-4 [Thalassophryne amazonica]|uniref:cyclic AMP-dependent transcription factor ATF-4 n=1 Tax=Thalassophryne amazonica TaxID=390379 RepID=UPI001471727E|nr:cyclic AMP-dependent transcription factor ATF-4 [Thalassophryne amazonica]XP_034043355.1 cyclic AMP-dependent transcription factor ATF-4 [Thalassophryne amazonica]